MPTSVNNVQMHLGTKAPFPTNILWKNITEMNHLKGVKLTALELNWWTTFLTTATILLWWNMKYTLVFPRVRNRDPGLCQG